MSRPHRVVIVGAGFGGLKAANVLSYQPEVEVVLIDQRNYHLFQPLLYQVATAGLNPADIAVPIRAQFANTKNVEVHLGRVTEIDLVGKEVLGPHLKVGFDFLILACGAQHSYFDHPEWEEFAPGLKTVEQAIEIRRRILLAFENAENAPNEEDQKALLTFVVVGGGPTGVELAGAIADISRTVLVRDFKRIDPSQARVILLEAGPRVLAQFHESLSVHTLKDLRGLGVEVQVGARVTGMDKTGVQVGKDWIAARTVFWAAGVQAASFNFKPDLVLDRSGRVKVAKDLSVPGFSNVFAVGDMAALEIAPQTYLPGLAPAAIQTGRYAAMAILKILRKQEHQPFIYVDKGLMATIGKYKAVVQWGRLQWTGSMAWLAWLFVHILFLIGFKNRVFVLFQWTWSYLFSKRGARLITESSWKLRS
jgi:NADH dehydrogenase